MKEIDFYGVLGLFKNATDEQIKKAYRQLALKYNPERTKKPEFNDAFALIGEAYEVLDDPLKKAIYDQYGESGLKHGVITPDGWFPPFYYHGEPKVTFKNFFGTDNPYSDLLDVLDNPPQMAQGSQGTKTPLTKDPPFIKPLALSLEEVYKGATKKLKIQRKEFIDDTKSVTALRERILTIKTKPGIKQGSKIIFREAGDQNINKVPGDVIFVVEYKPHPRFHRQGNDLVMVMELSLVDSLGGTNITINTLDDRKFKINLTDVITTGFCKVVEGEGMPVYRSENDERGNLLIKFEVEFPKYLSKAKREAIAKLLTAPEPFEMCPERQADFVTMDHARRTITSRGTNSLSSASF